MLRNIVHLRGVDNVTSGCPPNRMDGESNAEIVVENVIHSGKSSHSRNTTVDRASVELWRQANNDRMACAVALQF